PAACDKPLRTLPSPGKHTLHRTSASDTRARQASARLLRSPWEHRHEPEYAGRMPPTHVWRDNSLGPPAGTHVPPGWPRVAHVDCESSRPTPGAADSVPANC